MTTSNQNDQRFYIPPRDKFDAIRRELPPLKRLVAEALITIERLETALDEANSGQQEGKNVIQFTEA